MSILLTTLLSALVPVGVDGIKQVITHFTGGVKPATVEEQLKLDDQEIKRMEALARLDNPGGTPSQWVIDLRGSSRYLAAFTVIIGGIALGFTPDVNPAIQLVGFEGANIAFGFLFGQRVIANFKK